MNLMFFSFKDSTVWKRPNPYHTMVDVKSLSDYELQNELNKLGFSPGPILRMYAANIRDGSFLTYKLPAKI